MLALVRHQKIPFLMGNGRFGETETYKATVKIPSGSCKISTCTKILFYLGKLFAKPLLWEKDGTSSTVLLPPT